MALNIAKLPKEFGIYPPNLSQVKAGYRQIQPKNSELEYPNTRPEEEVRAA